MTLVRDWRGGRIDSKLEFRGVVSKARRAYLFLQSNLLLWM